MTTFLVIVVLATLVTAGLLAVPLLRNPAGPAPGAAVVAALLVPAATLLLYLWGSDYDWQSPPAPPSANTASGVPGLEEAVAGLEARLQSNPEEREGWLLLGNSYLQMGRFEDAEAAFSRALALSDDQDPWAKLGIAEARVLVDRDALRGETGELVEEALAALPEEPRALWYGGLTALARDDMDAVQARWTRLLATDLPDEVSTAIREQLVALGLRGDAVASAETTGTVIDVQVAVAEELQERIGTGATLFLAARDAEQPGPPLAAIREQATGLPRRLTLSDANAMMAGRNLSTAGQIRLVARVSNAGDAMPRPGDLFGEATWNAGDGPVNIVIDRIVQP